MSKTDLWLNADKAHRQAKVDQHERSRAKIRRELHQHIREWSEAATDELLRRIRKDLHP